MTKQSALVSVAFLVPRRAAEAVVVLRAAVDVIERRVLADGDVVHLRGGQVGFEDPGGGAVEAFVEAAVAAHQVVIVVLRVDPDFVIVHVLVARAAARSACGRHRRDTMMFTFMM